MLLYARLRHESTVHHKSLTTPPNQGVWFTVESIPVLYVEQWSGNFIGDKSATFATCLGMKQAIYECSVVPTVS